MTVVLVLPLCNQNSRLLQVKELHDYSIRHNISSCCSVTNALINIYCKCGCLEIASKIFLLMTERNVFTYTTLICSLGKHGHAEHAFVLFVLMKRDVVSPDKVTS